MSDFYKQALSEWVKFRQNFRPTTISDIKDMFLFGNNEIRCRGKPIFFKSFLKSDIVSMKDIWDPILNDFITAKHLLTKLKYKQNWISEWHIIKASIPLKYIKALKENFYSGEKYTTFFVWFMFNEYSNTTRFIFLLNKEGWKQ